MIEQRRADDKGVLCWIAARASQAWDFVDNRDIDKHLMAWAIMAGTMKLAFWTLQFAYMSPRGGTDVAAIIAAIWLPWSAVQGAVVNWYFKART